MASWQIKIFASSDLPNESMRPAPQQIHFQRDIPPSTASESLKDDLAANSSPCKASEPSGNHDPTVGSNFDRPQTQDPANEVQNLDLTSNENVPAQPEELPKQRQRTHQETLCDNFFGNQMVSNAKDSKARTCTPPSGSVLNDGTNVILSSSLDCYKFHSSPGDDVFCEGSNIHFDFDKLTSPNPEWYVYNQALSGVCDMDTQFFGDSQHVRFANGDYYKNFVGDSQMTLQCSEIIEDPVLVVTRDGEKNLAFALTDFVNAYSVLKTVGLLGHPNLRILIMDQAPEGPFIHLWRQLFSINHEPMWAREFMSTNGGLGSACFRHLIFALPGPLGFLNANVRQPHPCSNSEILEEFSDLVSEKLNLPLDVANLQQKSQKIPTITLICRRPYTDSNGGILREIGRQFKNENEMIDYFKSVEERENRNFKFQVVDLAKISINEQIRIMKETDILFGAHGAGMAHILFLPRYSVVVEMFPRRVNSKRYSNWAKFAPSQKYTSWLNPKFENNFPRPDVRPGQGYWDADMYIEIQDLQRLLDDTLNIYFEYFIGIDTFV